VSLRCGRLWGGQPLAVLALLALALLGQHWRHEAALAALRKDLASAWGIQGPGSMGDRLGMLDSAFLPSFLPPFLPPFLPSWGEQLPAQPTALFPLPWPLLT